jgi:hypothetical protein
MCSASAITGVVDTAADIASPNGKLFHWGMDCSALAEEFEMASDFDGPLEKQHFRLRLKNQRNRINTRDLGSPVQATVHDICAHFHSVLIRC